MDRILQSRCWSALAFCRSQTSRRAATLGVLATVLAVAASPVPAQTSSPEIAAKERSDPAAGEVVIINRKKSKGKAPNPYGPIKLKPLPEKWPKAKKPADKPIKKATPKPPAPKLATLKPKQRDPETTTSQTARAPIPPLPELNRDRRSPNARLKQFPQAALRTAPERPPVELDQAPPPRRAVRRPYRERPLRRYRERRRYSVRNRPWRLCRRLARRCRRGFDGSCYIWERRCT